MTDDLYVSFLILLFVFVLLLVFCLHPLRKIDFDQDPE